MSAFYDEDTDTNYYDEQMVINITEYDDDDERDMDIFVVYDKEDRLFYLYGARSTDKNFTRFMKTFEYVSDVYKFIELSTALKKNHRVSISVNSVSGLTNHDNYDDFYSKVSGLNEIVAYDNMFLSKKDFYKFVDSFLY
jgi:hypothetical protein